MNEHLLFIDHNFMISAKEGDEDKADDELIMYYSAKINSDSIMTTRGKIRERVFILNLSFDIWLKMHSIRFALEKHTLKAGVAEW